MLLDIQLQQVENAFHEVLSVTSMVRDRTKSFQRVDFVSKPLKGKDEGLISLSIAHQRLQEALDAISIAPIPESEMKAVRYGFNGL